MVTTLLTPAVVSMLPAAVADVAAVEDEEDDDGEEGAEDGGRRLARMMLLPWPACGCPTAGVMRRGRS